MAADRLLATLRAHGVDRVFCVPGESFLPVLDRLAGAGIDLVTCRHEGGAAFMALADAKLTGTPGVVLVNRGPGATNAAIAVHSADLDATGLLLIVGDVRTAERGRRSFQELDHQAAFAGMSRGVFTVGHPRHVAEFTARALAAARGGVPGPAVLVVPEDVLAEPVPPSVGGAPVVTEPARPPAGAVDRTLALLTGSERPVLVAGGRLDSPQGRRALREAARRHRLPVLVTNKRQDLFDNTDPLYAGHLNLATPPRQRDLIGRSDLVLAVGTRLDAVSTQRYTLPDPATALVHVYPDATVPGGAYQPRLAYACSPTAFLEQLAAAPPRAPADDGWLRQLAGHEAEQARWHPVTASDGVVFGQVVAALGELTSGRGTVTVDAGNFTSWVHRYHRVADGGRLLGIGSSAMGFGVPAGVAAALRRPGEPTVVFVGDGGFLMTGTELATAVRYRARVVIVVADNGSYGTIRQHQERAYPGRVAGTDLTNPDFALLAHAYGALGLTIGTDAEVEPVLSKALAHRGPVVVHVRTSLAHISAYQHLAGLRRTR
ncbi:thiamine pyrophosphate-dependent enzyme [Micromonospora sp. WMMD1082]|uniref:thiamine pyrophosphate-dependent enzyme n=1 Tax=Micromonospora sp. WMMD1082 TaxID=3016104 RepID=UPI002416B5D0|nr:thiamine pyrophosphate-dependent enzyme [Micromonospora sp. WMMD1082]MDG4797019.1 thiamine pyrophosphate-binding protein [Micromonospora sp. WMMD1082]